MTLSGKVHAAILTLALIALPATSAGAGHLSKTETWTAAESPYVLDEDHVVDSDTQLVIEAGVEVRAATGVRLLVEGQLNVEGTAADPVSFTVTPDGERWGGLVVASKRRAHFSSITGAIFERAATALRIDGATAEVVGSTFHTNLVGVEFVNPDRDVAVHGSVFENNRKAVTGYTRNVVTLYDNDFWNNPTTLLAKPQPMYDCGPDAGIWDVNSNDILRGPVNSEFYSNDFRTPKGSAPSDYRVLATGNWWGTSEEQRVIGRFSPYFNCCPTPARQAITWRPIASIPQTTYEPVGENPDPEPEFPSHADPGLPTRVTSPRHGSCHEADTFRSLRGGFGAGLGGPAEVTVALRKRTPSGCRWWDHKRRELVPGDCGKKRWMRAEVDRSQDPWRWEYRFPSRLPTGRYMAWSFGFAEPTHLGRNQVAFRLR